VETKGTLQSGLQKTVKWYLENDKWVNKLINKPEYRDWINQNYAHRQGEKE